MHIDNGHMLNQNMIMRWNKGCWLTLNWITDQSVWLPAKYILAMVRIRPERLIGQLCGLHAGEGNQVDGSMSEATALSGHMAAFNSLVLGFISLTNYVTDQKH